MKVCMDIQAAIGQTAGVGRYARTLAEGLGEQAGTDRLSLFYFDFRGNTRTFSAPGASIKRIQWCPGRLAQKAWKTIKWPPFDMLAGPADLYFFPNFVAPPVRKGRSVVAIHDMSHVRFPQFAEERNLRYLNGRLADSARRADAIITISHFSAGEISEVLGIGRDRIFPIYPGISEDFKPPDPGSVATRLPALGISQPYLLTVGTLEPRKNIPMLIEIFEKMDTFKGMLVIAGMPGWKTEPILQRIRQSPRADEIMWLRYVDHADLLALYNGAKAFATTSFYEGFGFTPLEAMACGAPVVSATAGSLREALGEGAVLIDDYDPDRWVEALNRLLTEPDARRHRIERGLKWVQRYAWSDTIRQTWEVFRKVAS